MNILFALFVLFVKSQDLNSDLDVDNVEPSESYFDKSHPLRDSKELLSLDLKESEDVKTSFKIVPQHNESLLFYLGDVVEILLGFENTGSQDLYITDVSGAFVSPHDNTQFVYNNTAVHHNITAKPNEYHSFYYPFHVSPHSNPIDYGVVAIIYYVNARGDEFRSVVVNETLVVKDAPSAIKAGKFFLIILVIAVVLTLGIVFRNQIIDFFVGIYNRITNSTARRSTGGRRTTGNRSRTVNEADDNDADEWIKNTSTHAFQKNQQREKEREKKKNLGVKRDISQSPNPGLSGPRKRGRSPPNDSGGVINTGGNTFVLKKQD